MVFRSIRHIYPQVIDDTQGITLAMASDLDSAFAAGSGGQTKKELATMVGSLVAERARAAGVSRVVFDRGGYLYHGRVRALADGARQKELEF